MTSEKFDKLQYDTYRAIALSMIALAIATLIGAGKSSGSLQLFLKILSLMFFIANLLSLGLFFKFYARLRRRYS